MSIIIAASCHDFKHDGYSNGFHSNSMSYRAIISNDQAVQENFHVSQSFIELIKEDQNFIESLT